MKDDDSIRAFFKLIYDEKHDVGVLVIYTLISGLLSLVVPIGAQVLVNTLTAGMFLNPLVVLSLLVFIGVSLYGLFQVVQLVIIEKIQQRIFVKTVIKLSNHLPGIRLSELTNKYAPEIVNRFFDTMTLQKSFAKILMYWPSAILQIFFGLFLICFYSIYLLIFTLIILFFLLGIYKLGSGAVLTSINESTEKYNMAHWLEDLARCNFAFKMSADSSLVNYRTDTLILNYLDKRSKHFKVLFRQYTSYYLFYSVASAGILVIGGWLVIDNKISLGQLVASEVIVLNILKATESFISFLDTYYDLLAGLDKLKSVVDLKVDGREGLRLENDKQALSIKFKNVFFRYLDKDTIRDVSFSISPGSKVGLLGGSGSGKRTISMLISGLLEPDSGVISINDIDMKLYDLNSLRSRIALILNANDIFNGTIEDNITLSNRDLSINNIQSIVNLLGLDKDFVKLKDGLKTNLVSNGLNISLGQRIKIIIARELLKNPCLLIIDQSLFNTDKTIKKAILDTIFIEKSDLTSVIISYDYDVISRCDYLYILDDGKIIEHGEPTKLFGDKSNIIHDYFVHRKF